jgi:hypothetical protein
MRQQREGIGNVQDFRLGAIGDAREVHPLVGGQEQIEKRVDLCVMARVKRQTCPLRQRVPEFLGHD